MVATHPGAQLRLTDAEGMRITAFATNIAAGQLSALEHRHRRRARWEDRICEGKDTGLAALPLHSFDQNRIWLEIVALAMGLKARMQTLTLTESQTDDAADHATAGARRWEPKKLRLRLYSIPSSPATPARQCSPLPITPPAPAAAPPPRHTQMPQSAPNTGNDADPPAHRPMKYPG